MVSADFLSSYFQGCFVDKDNFEHWIFHLSMSIDNMKYQNGTIPDVVFINTERMELLRVSPSTFLKEAKHLLSAMQDKPADKLSFPIAKTQAFMDRIRGSKLKPSPSDKTDIRIVLHDSRTLPNSNVEFRIKSQHDSNSILLNARDATNFTYRIEGYDFSDEEIDEINTIDTPTMVIDRINAINNRGAQLVFDKVDNDTFRSNLQMMDVDMARLIAYLLLEQFKTGNRMLSDLTSDLANDNPLSYEADDLQSIYAYKLKHLLTSAALGMMPSKPWTGRYDANGGYLVVKKDGEILCYHFYNHNRFEDFIFHNAYLERAKTRRHGYGSLYRAEDGKVYFKLNLQIRLK